jgi:hypothetical protein
MDHAHSPFNSLPCGRRRDVSDARDAFELAFGGDSVHELLGEGVETTFACARHRWSGW